MGLAILGLVGHRGVAFMLLVTVSILAMFLDIVPVLVSSVLSALIWDFFFIPPTFTFTVGTADDRLLLLMYFVIAMVNAALTNKIRRDAFLVFRALCKLSMKTPPKEATVDPQLMKGKIVALELLKILLENAGAVFRTSER